MRRLDDENDDDEPEPRQVRASLLTPPQLIFGNSYTVIMEKNCARMDSEGIEIPPVICSLTQVGPYRFNIPPLFQTKFILFCAGACPGLQR